MLIISRRKDYYDHLVSKWGVDNKIVYNREGTAFNDSFSAIRPLRPDECPFVFFILEVGNLKYLYQGTQVGWEIKDLTFIRKLNMEHRITRSNAPVSFSLVSLSYLYGYFFWDKRRKKLTVDLTTDEIDTKRWKSWKSLPVGRQFENIIISELPSTLPDAEEVFLEIQSFLSSLIKDGEESKLTDIQKVENHGFDAKKSFRHRK